MELKLNRTEEKEENGEAPEQADQRQHKSQELDPNLLTSELESNYAFYSALREPLLLSLLDHPNIINYKGVLRREAGALYLMYFSQI